MDYHDLQSIQECLEEIYATFRGTLDTADFVPEKYQRKIMAYIFKRVKRAFRMRDRAERKYAKEHKR